MKDHFDHRFDDRDVEIKGDHLLGFKFDFIVTGGIAAIEAPKMIRELRRYGAEIRAVMTESAHHFITPIALEWASKNPVLTHLSGGAEHITHADAVIVSPATLDFIAKASLGIADTPALTLLQSILGRRPLFIFPTMHESLWQNPIFQKNLALLKKIDQCFVFEANISESKRKARPSELMAAEICHHMSRSNLKDKEIVVTLGATRSYLDDVRFLSNISSGALGLEIAQDLFLRGAKVQIVAGSHTVVIPEYLPTVLSETVSEMKNALKKLGKVDAMILSAAVLDFEANKLLSEKKSSEKNWNIDLKPSPKIIDDQRKSAKVLVGFKLESRLSPEKLKEIVIAWNKTKKCDLVVSNRLEDISSKGHKAFILNAAEKEFVPTGSKRETAVVLSKELEKFF